MELLTTIITIAGSVLASSGISAVVIACLNRHWQKQDRNLLTKDDLKPIAEKLDTLTDNQKVVSVERIRGLVKQYKAAGKIELEEKENIMEMYQSYKRLGGNGHLDTIMRELEKIEVV